MAAAHRTGGELDFVLDSLRAQRPGLIVERLTVTHSGDDDNVYFIGDEGKFDLVQIDTTDGGGTPFSIEGDGGERFDTSDSAFAVAAIAA